MELASYIAMNEIEGKEERDMSAYSNPDSEEYKLMVEHMRIRLGLDSLKFQRVEDLVNAIGLPKEKVCTHCFDGSSYF